MLGFVVLVLAIELGCGGEGFEVQHEWTYLNFTWPSRGLYQKAIEKGRYVPENNVAVGVKLYKDDIYLSLLRIRDGTPVTLATIKNVKGYDGVQKNTLLKPFPSWEMNVRKSCKTLQNVQSMEIDSKGIMWVLDGTRIGNFSDCPGKLVLLDLNDGGKVVYSHTFPDEICMRKGCWLNDIVLEERFGGYAYISESSNSDPGLIVFSRMQGRAWKLRDSSMFADVNVVNYTVGGVLVNTWINVDSLAMAPVPKDRSEDRKIFYSPLSSKSLYSISDRILRNETEFFGTEWRKHVQFLFFRPSNSDGMIVDTRGDLYMGYLTKYAIAKWNIKEKNLKTVSTSVEEIVWPDSFAMDNDGNLYNLADSVNRFLINNGPLQIPREPIIRILKMHTGTKSYLHTAL